MRLMAKLMAGCIALVVMMGLIGGTALVMNYQTDARLTEMRDTYWTGATAAEDLRANVLAMQGNVMCYVNNESEALAEIEEIEEEIGENRETLEASGVFDGDDIEETFASIDEFIVIVGDVVAAVDSGDPSEVDEAVEAMDEMTEDLNGDLNELVEDAKVLMDERIADLHSMIVLADIILVSALVAASVFSLAFAVLFARSVTRPISRMTEAADAVSSGKGEFRFLNIERDDEIGVLAKSFDRMMNSVKLAMEVLEREK